MRSQWSLGWSPIRLNDTKKRCGYGRESRKGKWDSCDTRRVEHEGQHGAIIDTAAQKACDLIAMGPGLVVGAPPTAFASQPLC